MAFRKGIPHTAEQGVRPLSGGTLPAGLPGIVPHHRPQAEFTVRLEYGEAMAL